MSSAEVIRYAITETSLGRVLVARSEHGLCAVSIGDNSRDLVQALARRFPRASLSEAGPGSTRWFATVASVVEDPSRAVSEEIPPLDMRGTPFQLAVWQQLLAIPFGTTITYGELAERVGRPKAFRAVAQACAANPISVIVPCHRVIGGDGSLTGFASGIQRKRALLKRENVL